MYDLQTKYQAQLLARQARELKQMKDVIQKAHKEAAQMTNDRTLVTVELLDKQTLFSPNPNRFYFRMLNRIYSINQDQFKGEIEKTMGCDCFAVSDKQSMETCISYIVTHYGCLLDYIYQNTGLTLENPYREESGIEQPQEETIFFDEDQYLGEIEYE